MAQMDATDVSAAQMRQIGTRLREERVRLDKTQADFAEAGGVQKRAQGNYEAGERSPDGVYFAGVAALGVDVQYVVTGKRQSAAPPPALHLARHPQAPYESQPQVQTQRLELGAPDDWPATPKGPLISLDLMNRVVGLVALYSKKTGRVLTLGEQAEMLVRLYNYIVEDDDEKDEALDAADREIKKVLRGLVNG